jgi:hypothetical protein
MKRLAFGSAGIYALADKKTELWPSIVMATYKEIIGEMARNLPAVDFKDGLLTLTARNKAWKKEGQSFEESIRNGLNKQFEREIVKSVQWVTWPWPAKQKAEKNTDYSTNYDISEELERISRRITDEDIRAAFRTFVAAVLRSRMTETEQI